MSPIDNQHTRNAARTTRTVICRGLVRVRAGWSGQTGTNPDTWGKADVELEEDDLRRLVSGICGPRDVDIVCKIIPTALAYQLLEVEAEILIYTKLMIRHGYPADQGRAKLDELRQQKAALSDKVHELAAS